MKVHHLVIAIFLFTACTPTDPTEELGNVLMSSLFDADIPSELTQDASGKKILKGPEEESLAVSLKNRQLGDLQIFDLTKGEGEMFFELFLGAYTLEGDQMVSLFDTAYVPGNLDTLLDLNNDGIMEMIVMEGVYHTAGHLEKYFLYYQDGNTYKKYPKPLAESRLGALMGYTESKPYRSDKISYQANPTGIEISVEENAAWDNYSANGEYLGAGSKHEVTYTWVPPNLEKEKVLLELKKPSKMIVFEDSGNEWTMDAAKVGIEAINDTSFTVSVFEGDQVIDKATLKSSNLYNIREKQESCLCSYAFLYQDVDGDNEKDLMVEYFYAIGAGPKAGVEETASYAFLKKQGEWTKPEKLHSYFGSTTSHLKALNHYFEKGYVLIGEKVMQFALEDLLMKKGEDLIMTFNMEESDKRLTIALYPNQYLVYRFGTRDNIELEVSQVPDEPEDIFQFLYEDNWGYVRFKRRELFFNRGEYEYRIFDNDVHDKEKYVDGYGVLIRHTSGKTTLLKGTNRDGRLGYLSDLEWLETENIFGAYEDER